MDELITARTGAMLWNGWNPIVRIILVGTLGYLSLIVLLRVSGKRTLSKMNAFDLVVTVALGSSLSSVLLSKSVVLAEGIAGFVTLIGLQYAITWLSVRSQSVAELVKSEPTLVAHCGKFLPGALHRERVLESEVLSALRKQGVSDLSDVQAVILETDGSFSVVPKAAGNGEAIAQVR